MASHSTVHAWRILRTEEPGGLQFMGLQRAGHDKVAKNSTALIMGGDTGNWGNNKIYISFFGRNIPTLGFHVSVQFSSVQSLSHV